MPHAVGPDSGFQAFILCGPGASLDTFTSDPVEFPKAIVPVANRPMVWYPLEWSYRLGVSEIFLITPQESRPALEAAMSQNPHLTGLPLPKPVILTPTSLTNISGTAEIFRTKEVRDAVRGDFLVLPCDIVSEVDGLTLLQEWMVHNAGYGGASGGLEEDTDRQLPRGIGGERAGRRGALGMWYDTKGQYAVKGEPTDFIATVPLPKPITPVSPPLIRDHVAHLVAAMPTDSLNDKTEASELFVSRQLLSRKHGQVNLRTSMRDAHVYFFPYWAIDLLQNDSFESLGEDAVGSWAKATWQKGIADQLGLQNILNPAKPTDAVQQGESGELVEQQEDPEDEINPADYSSTLRQHSSSSPKEAELKIPPILAYTHRSTTGAPLVKRVDNVPSLLAVSLKLAKLSSLSTSEKATAASPFAHTLKIAHPDTLPISARVEESTCLLAENVTLGDRCNIKESVIGTGCTLGVGVRLTKCVLMDDVTVGDNVVLANSVLGRRCKVEGGSFKSEDKTSLDTCEVQGGYVVPWGTQAKGEKFMLFEGLDDTLKMNDDSNEEEDEETS